MAFRYFLKVLIMSFGLFTVSCKSTKSIVGGEIDAGLSTRKIIQNHYDLESSFKTLSGRVKIDYSNGKDEQGVTVNYRMKKNEVIWMSAPFGVVKAYITPEKVSFYNKLEGEYFEGGFDYLSKFVGIDIDFHQLQNLLLGNAISDLRKAKYKSEASKAFYRLKPKQSTTFLKTLFVIEPQNFRIAEQQVSQPIKERILNVNYKYQSVQNVIVPEQIVILASESESENKISLEFRGIELNRSLNFPFKVPKGYKKMTLGR